MKLVRCNTSRAVCFAAPRTKAAAVCVGKPRLARRRLRNATTCSDNETRADEQSDRRGWRRADGGDVHPQTLDAGESQTSVGRVTSAIDVVQAPRDRLKTRCVLDPNCLGAAQCDSGQQTTRHTPLTCTACLLDLRCIRQHAHRCFYTSAEKIKSENSRTDNKLNEHYNAKTNTTQTQRNPIRRLVSSPAHNTTTRCAGGGRVDTK